MNIDLRRSLGGIAMIASMSIALAACGQPDRDSDSTVGAAISAAPAVRPEDQAVMAAVEKAALAKAEEAKRIERAEAERLSRIRDIRRKDPALNWISIGISTGKFSEQIETTVHRTYAECARSSSMEVARCVPILKLPRSYWEAGK